MTEKSILDRRKGIRAQRVLSIQFRLFKKAETTKTIEDSPWHHSTTHDMSYSGISFLSTVPFQIDDILELNVVMSGLLDIVDSYGQIVRVQKKEHGAQYIIAVKLISKHLATHKNKS